MIKKITIFGAGYVGMSLGTLLSQEYPVTIVDKDKDRVKKICNQKSTIEDSLIQDYLSNKNLDIHATSNLEEGVLGADIIILALPTNFITSKNTLDTGIIEGVIDSISSIDKKIPIIIKSTIPSGFSDLMDKNHPNEIIFSPEFLREGNALKDNLYPSRIIMGSNSNTAYEVANILKSLSKNNPEIILMNNEEAEAVKLFSNSYLATRVSFFNEIDSYCISKGLDPRSVINGVSSDKRIGNHYNNPSFGYGGYCLPKDTKQLLSSFEGIPQNIISATVNSNKTRKSFIYNHILKINPKAVGIYRITMKTDSDNIRESAIIDVMLKLKNADIKVYIYEPILEKSIFLGVPVIKSLDEFINTSELILTNRKDSQAKKFKDKLFSRDIFGNN